ncbi:glycosyltransferase family 1 protein [Paenibacillus oryzisoli]|uniref:glycosyltransferase family 4 protein n=1 Tax=Paenibacillus oryzisoli TaxID=1850517 RepID=UPI003D269617
MNLKVAVPIIGGEKWGGGVTYLEYLARSNSLLPKDKKLELYLIVRPQQLSDFTLHKSFLNYFKGIVFVGSKSNEVVSLLGDAVTYCESYDELATITDVYFPVNSNVLPHRCSISWIPDFQHKYLSGFFTKEEVEYRDSKFKEVADQARMIVFSSESAKKDFLKFYSNSEAITEVLKFYLLPNDEWYSHNPDDVLQKYGLTSNFVLCSNQFWAHKNHQVLFQAIKALKNKGIEVNLVCTGATRDYRNDEYFSDLIKQIDEDKLTENIKILGFIPREDQIQLIRRSKFVIQPSLFEGWSTIVEDCRVLGKTILMSDIDVHVEQAPRYGFYFNKDDAVNLASQIHFLLDLEEDAEQMKNKENKAKTEAFENVKKYAEKLYSLIYIAVVDFNKK